MLGAGEAIGEAPCDALQGLVRYGWWCEILKRAPQILVVWSITPDHRDGVRATQFYWGALEYICVHVRNSRLDLISKCSVKASSGYVLGVDRLERLLPQWVLCHLLRHQRETAVPPGTRDISDPTNVADDSDNDKSPIIDQQLRELCFCLVDLLHARFIRGTCGGEERSG